MKILSENTCGEKKPVMNQKIQSAFIWDFFFIKTVLRFKKNIQFIENFLKNTWYVDKTVK